MEIECNPTVPVLIQIRFLRKHLRDIKRNLCFHRFVSCFGLALATVCSFLVLLLDSYRYNRLNMIAQPYFYLSDN